MVTAAPKRMICSDQSGLSQHFQRSSEAAGSAMFLPTPIMDSRFPLIAAVADNAELPVGAGADELRRATREVLWALRWRARGTPVAVLSSLAEDGGGGGS